MAFNELILFIKFNFFTQKQQNFFGKGVAKCVKIGILCTRYELGAYFFAEKL